MRIFIDPRAIVSDVNPMIYGQFLEHFHRIVYGGIYDPASPNSDKDGIRQDVIEALKEIHVPVIRWPGGCFASDYHWKNGIGNERPAVYDKAWRVTEPNTFGTNEFINFCRKLGAEPYICTNAGTGTPEEMSDWVEYCNLDKGGYWAEERKKSGNPEPFHVHYWSIGNENYSDWEMGSKSAEEWPRFVLESAKMMIRTDPTIELSAAALPDINWDLGLLKACGKRIQWVSIHKYWDEIYNTNDAADYAKVMSYTADLDEPVRKIRGVINALGLEGTISVAFDEWNLRGWYHPNMFTDYQGRTLEEYLIPRNQNDANSTYTLADTIFTGCVLNMFIRNSDLIKMACYSPVVNVRGLIYTWSGGIVKRGSFYVFRLLTEYMGDMYIKNYNIDEIPEYNENCHTYINNKNNTKVYAIDYAVTKYYGKNVIAISLINKCVDRTQEVFIELPKGILGDYRCLYSVTGNGPNSYNDIDREEISLHSGKKEKWFSKVVLPPASVNVLQVWYSQRRE